MTTNRSTIKARNTNVSAGIDKHVTAAVAIGGVTYTPAQLKAVFTTQTAALDAADALHKQWTDQLQVATAANAKANKVYLLLRSYLLGQNGTDANSLLNDFGMNVPKSTGPRTVQQKAEAVAKRAATRLARHTMGKVQKKSVTGVTAAAAAAAATPAAHVSPSAPTVAPSAPETPAPSPAKPATVS